MIDDNIHKIVQAKDNQIASLEQSLVRKDNIINHYKDIINLLYIKQEESQFNLDREKELKYVHTKQIKLDL